MGEGNAAGDTADVSHREIMELVREINQIKGGSGGGSDHQNLKNDEHIKHVLDKIQRYNDLISQRLRSVNGSSESHTFDDQ